MLPPWTRWAEAAEPVLPAAEVAEVVEGLSRPARTVVAGRVGVGKTTLVNRWCGADRPTGLGGVTRRAEVLKLPGAEVVDTPGVDRPETAFGVLQPLLDTADVLVWVVDGLQPLTHSERKVIHEVLPADVPLVVLVGRADLLGGEQDQVLQRVSSQLGGQLSSPPVALDLRVGSLPSVPRAPSARARRAAGERVVQLRAGLPPAPVPLDDTLAHVRSAVRELVEDFVGDLHAGRLAQKVDARLALRQLGPEALEAVLPGVRVPAVAPVPHGRMARALGSMSGLEGAERLLRADAARWLAEVELAVVEAFDEHPEWLEAAARREDFEGATDELLAALSSPSEP